MGQRAALVFSNITIQQFSILSAKAQAAGIGLNGNSGTATKHGIEVAWNYLPETEVLTLQCLRTPFFVKPEDVEARIQELVKETVNA